MAAPVVAGAAALIPQKNPGLKPNAVKAVLMYSAERRYESVLEVGAGYLKIAGAVNMAANIDSSAPVGAYWLTNNGVGLTYYSVIKNSPVLWSRNVLWGNGLYGGTFLNYNSLSWGETIVWSETIVCGETIVWGESAETAETPETVVWGDSTETETHTAIPVPGSGSVITTQRCSVPSTRFGRRKVSPSRSTLSRRIRQKESEQN